MSKSAIAIRHLAFEDLGAFESVLREAGFTLDYREAGCDPLDGPEFTEADLLFVLGGPIGAYEEDIYPFLSDEIRLIEKRLAAGRPLMGICLGAQLMARALGAKVFPGPAKEFGFKPIILTEAGQASPFAAFAGEEVLHWHGDTFDLPEGATLLASTDICAHQAFALGPQAIGIQFHPEAGGDGFERWLIGHAFELAKAGVDIRALRARNEQLRDGLKDRAKRFLKHWLALPEVGALIQSGGVASSAA